MLADLKREVAQGLIAPTPSFFLIEMFSNIAILRKGHII
jgi:hypothetical protein